MPGCVSQLVPMVLAVIRADLAARRCTITRLSEVSGVTRTVIYAAIAARDGSKTVRVIGRLADALGVQVEMRLSAKPGSTAVIPADTPPYVGPISGVVPVVLDLVRAEMAAGRATMSRLAALSGVSRTMLYVVLDPEKPAQTIPMAARLAEALGVQAELRLITGHGPVDDPVEEPQGLPIDLDNAPPPIQRWLGNSVVQRAWTRHRPDIVATAAALRMPVDACRLRLQVIGLSEPTDAAAAALLRMYKPVATARLSGLPVSDIAEMCHRTRREVRAMLRTLAISGSSDRPAHLRRRSTAE